MKQQTQKAQMTDGRGREIEVVGEVISNKMHKTISVQIFRLVRHKKYGKYMRRSSVFKAHDENNTAKMGDVVRIVHTRPLSKTKRWKLAEILQKAQATEDIKDETRAEEAQ
ncbi:MAG: 30S ribosomal protein S17 [Bdellovibrionaceae bacterium]|nr:30S ribosomal protein S17 [Pseudobdellovibrionaceae bacterium]